MYDVEEEYARYVGQVGGRIISSNQPVEEIREARTSMGIIQEELGRLMGLRRETISRIENGSINPTFNFVTKFCRTIAAAKVVRDLQALEEVYHLSGKEVTSISPGILRPYFDISPEDLEIIFRIGVRGYRKSRNKIIKSMK